MYIPEIPKNNLKPQLEELVYIIKKIADETDEEDKFFLQFSFEPPATDEEINRFKASFHTPLPMGYEEFLRFSNGAELCGHIARFDNITKVVNINKMKRTPDFSKDYIAVASIIGDGELLCFSTETGKFIRFFDGREIVFDNFYDAFNEILRLVKTSASDYVDF